MSTDEDKLREVAGLEAYAIEVLADYYEQNGQPSRAALWRDPERARKTLFAPPPDFLLTSSGPTDPRRNAMIWLLMNNQTPPDSDARPHGRKPRFDGTALYRIAKLFALSSSMIRHVVTQHDGLIRRSADEESRQPTMRATQRLIEAKAIRVPVPVYVDRAIDTSGGSITVELCEVQDLYLSQIEMPPDSWPHTKCIGIMGPKQVQLEHRHPIPDPVSDQPLFKRHGVRKDTTPRGPRMPRPR